MPATAVEGHETSAVPLGAMLDAGDCAILTLVAGNTRLAVHRAVLAARSHVFAVMFSHDSPEKSSGEYAIRDVGGSELRKLVTFMYSGTAPQLPGMTPQLLEAATKYGVTGLRDAFEHQLARQLTVDNAAAKAVLAVTHDYPTLRKAAVAFIRSHVLEVMATPGWAESVHNYPGAVVEFTRLLMDAPIEASGATTTTRPHSVDGHTTVAATAAATPFPTCPSTAPLDDAAVSRLRNLSSDEKGERLFQAAQKGAMQEVRLLLAAGADVGARDENKLTALHHAAYCGHVELAQCLLQAGAEVDARERKQETPLHDAAARGYVAVVRLLLAASADLTARQQIGWTPLHYAAVNNQAEVATVLIKAGADTEAIDNKWRTPLDLAREHKRQQVVQILEKY